MAVKYTGGKTVTVTVGNLASDTIACAYWYTGAVSPKGYSYVIKGLLDDGNNSTSTDFSYNTLLKGDNSSNTTATTTFKTVDNIYDSTNGRYPTYVWAYINLLPHFHYPSEYGNVIKSSYIEVRQRQNSISSSNSSFSVYWNEGGASSKTISPTITCSPSNSYTKTINVKHSNASITESSSTVTSGNALSIKVKGKGSSTITLSPSDGAGGTSTTISVTGKTAVTNMTATYTGNLNTGASTSMTVSKIPSNADATTFSITKTGTGTLSTTSGTFGTAFNITGTGSSPVITVTSADGLKSNSFKITNYTATVACSGSTPLRGQTFTYTQSGGYGTGTYSFNNCEHYSAGKAKVTANSGTATVKWTPSDGGTAHSGSITLGISTTSIAINGNTSGSGSVSINSGATAKMKVNIYGPGNAVPKTNSFTASLSGAGTLSATSGSNGSTINVTGAADGTIFRVTSGDELVSSSANINVYTPFVYISAYEYPIYRETFTYSLSNYTGSGTWSFTYCKHVATGTAEVTAYSGTATVKWTPSDGGTPASKSITLGVTATSVAINGNTSASTEYINNGGSKSLTINLYGPNNVTPKDRSFTIAAPNTSLSISSGTTGDTITINGISGSSTVTVTSGDSNASNSITLIEKNPVITLSNTSNNWKGKTFTYTLSDYVGSGTWSFNNCKHYSSGNAMITGTSGSATVKWTPNDGGTPVSKSLTLKTYTTPSTSISFADIASSYYYDDIYWHSFAPNVTNSGGRNIDLSINNGVIGTTASGSATSVTVSSGSTVWARRSNSSEATVTANVSALTVNNSTTYTFYNAATATKTIL